VCDLGPCFDLGPIETSDLTTIILSVIALFAPLGLFLFYQKYGAPKLKATYQHREPMARLSSRSGRRGRASGVPIYDFHFLVENSGRRPAEMAVAVVTEFWYDGPSGKLVKMEDFMPVPLRYDASGDKVDVYPHRQYYWNIGCIPSPRLQAVWDRAKVFNAPGKENGGLRFALDLYGAPYYQVNKPSKGEYGIRVALYSKNAKPAEIRLKVCWTGEWKDTAKEMFEQIKIQKVERFS